MPTDATMTDRAVLPCRRCGDPAHWFDWTRWDGEQLTQPLCDAEMEALCITCAVALPDADLCACQHCQREIRKLRRRQ